jgi:hypothetical protein
VTIVAAFDEASGSTRSGGGRGNRRHQQRHRYRIVSAAGSTFEQFSQQVTGVDARYVIEPRMRERDVRHSE